MERKTFKPPQNVANVAQKGLLLRKKYNRGGTGVGITRAYQLSKKENISLSTVKRMYSFFKRHSVFKEYHGQNPPSNSEISWLLWGGDVGFEWVKDIIDKNKKVKR
jgi:hypothetical protein